MPHLLPTPDIAVRIAGSEEEPSSTPQRTAPSPEPSVEDLLTASLRRLTTTRELFEQVAAHG